MDPSFTITRLSILDDREFPLLIEGTDFGPNAECRWLFQVKNSAGNSLWGYIYEVLQLGTTSHGDSEIIAEYWYRLPSTPVVRPHSSGFKQHPSFSQALDLLIQDAYHAGALPTPLD